MFAANLKALTPTSAATVSLLRKAVPHDGVAVTASQRGEPTGIIEQNGRRLALASRRDPAQEARHLAETADLSKAAAIVVLGFGLGHHVRELVRRVAGHGVVIVYEPDPTMLRAVLEQIDCTDFLGAEFLTILCGDVDAAELVRRFDAIAGTITQGVQIITHPPTRQLHPGALNDFTERFTQFVAFCRTNVATTLVNMPVTVRNLVHNLGHYAAGATIDELGGAATGCPAVIVSAGPSLAKNVHLLTQPGVRDRVVIIAVQTALRPLLDRGVRPHFVTALDYHEISRRFYEDLPPLADVTLVAEPKAHWQVIDGYPGPIRVLQNHYLDVLLSGAARPMGGLKAGSTVAHLSLYLGQYLGCDPIIFIGQDLGFSNGLYYCPGTAIHDVWTPELNTFNTLEMMEWRRIARHKSHLRRLTDHLGRLVYSDEQMITYLRQFERDFAEAKQTIIDATEGGVPKQHTVVMTLREALSRHAACSLPKLPMPRRTLDTRRLAEARRIVAHRIAQVEELRDISRKTLPLLRRMKQDQHDEAKFNRHFERLADYRRQVDALGDAFALVNDLNQVGAFRRLKADRSLIMADGLDPYERQRRQLDRDIDNVRWITDGCEEAISLFSAALVRVDAQLEAAADPIHSPELIAAP